MFQFTKSYIQLQKLRGQQAKLSSWHLAGVSKGAGSTTGKVCQCYARILTTAKTGQSGKYTRTEGMGSMQAVCISYGFTQKISFIARNGAPSVLRSCRVQVFLHAEREIRLQSHCHFESFLPRLPWLLSGKFVSSDWNVFFSKKILTYQWFWSDFFSKKHFN